MNIARNHLRHIKGVRLALRLVTPSDAQFIHGLRTDPAYNMHLSPVTGTVEDQKAWIDAYKAREAAGEEFYYIIECRDGRPCGVVRLYGITEESFTWGSWILNADKPRKAALESALLSFSIGFETLGLMRAYIDVRKENARAIHFYRRFGMVENGTDPENLYFALTRARFVALRAALCDKLEAEALQELYCTVVSAALMSRRGRAYPKSGPILSDVERGPGDQDDTKVRFKFSPAMRRTAGDLRRRTPKAGREPRQHPGMWHI